MNIEYLKLHDVQKQVWERLVRFGTRFIPSSSYVTFENDSICPQKITEIYTVYLSCRLLMYRFANLCGLIYCLSIQQQVVSCCLCCIMYCYYRTAMGSFSRRDKLSDTIGLTVGSRRVKPAIVLCSNSPGHEGSMPRSPLPSLTPKSVQIPIRSRQLRKLKSIEDETPRIELKTLSPPSPIASNKSFESGNMIEPWNDSRNESPSASGTGSRNGSRTESLKPRFLEQFRLLSKNGKNGKNNRKSDSIHHSDPSKIPNEMAPIQRQRSLSPHLPVPMGRNLLHSHCRHMSHVTAASNASDASRSMTYITASSIPLARTDTNTNSSSNFDSWTSTDSLDLQPVDTDEEEVMGEDDYFIYKLPDDNATERMIEFVHNSYVE